MAISAQDISFRLELACRIAQEAGRHTLKYFQRADLAVDEKSDRSPVTVADREAELLLRQRISDAFPDDAILGEEFPERPGTSGYRWVLDPIDGTKSFIHGVPLYGTLVAVVQETQALLGVIDVPALGETVYAARGTGAWHVHAGGAPQPARVSSTARLADALVCTTDVHHCSQRPGGRGGEALDAILAQSRFVRTWGDCYGYLLVATGRADAMIDPVMNLWDAAAVAPIVEEAGGTFTNWQGVPTIAGGESVATNGHLGAELLALTRGR